jgi:DNA-binding NarL/FixJ family response regulator
VLDRIILSNSYLCSIRADLEEPGRTPGTSQICAILIRLPDEGQGTIMDVHAPAHVADDCLLTQQFDGTLLAAVRTLVDTLNGFFFSPRRSDSPSEGDVGAVCDLSVSLAAFQTRLVHDIYLGGSMPSHEEKGSDFISIVVADSTRIHTQLLSEALRSDQGMQVVASASSSQDVLSAVTRVPVDVAVISYSLDDQPGRGTEVLRELRSLRPQIKGVLLLDTSRPQDVLDCFRAGAKGIFSKQERLESLCKCIRCVHEGQIWARSVELEHALAALASSPQLRSTNQQGLELLSARERQVVQYLAAGMTNREIADSLGLSRHTIKNYLFRIFDKLGVSSRTELLYVTMSNGQPQMDNSLNGTAEDDFDNLLKAAEAGHAWAPLRLAEHYSESNGHPRDRVSAYMWCLVSETVAASLRTQIAAQKDSLGQSMSAEQLEEAERKAGDWLMSARKKAGSAEAAGEPSRTRASYVASN